MSTFANSQAEPQPDHQDFSQADEQARRSSLSGQQRALYLALAEKDEQLGRMYFGALLVLRQNENPDRVSLAAHGLRELMEKLPRYLDAPLEKSATLTQKVRELGDTWGGASRKSGCRNASSWSGPIDDPLRKFLAKVDAFFSWLETDRPTRTQQAARVIRGFDPSGIPLPEPIENLRVKEWSHYREHLENVSHHTTRSSHEDLTKWITTLEQFLLDRLRPRTFEDHDNIEQIIKEAEGND